MNKKILYLGTISMLIIMNIPIFSAVETNMSISTIDPVPELTIVDANGNPYADERTNDAEGKITIAESITKEIGQSHKFTYYLKNTGEEGSKLYINDDVWSKHDMKGKLSYGEYWEPILAGQKAPYNISYEIPDTKDQSSSQDLTILIYNEDSRKDWPASERFNRYYIEIQFTITGSKEKNIEQTKVSNILSIFQSELPIFLKIVKSFQLN